jgi:hypothetical protein
MTNELTIIQFTPAIIQANFEEFKANIMAEVSKYDVVVTYENLEDCKKKATELNKISQAIDAERKKIIKESEAPVREFDDKMKGVVKICQDGRSKLTQQIEVFNEAERKKCFELCQALVLELYNEQAIETEFRNVAFEDLAIMSNITKTGQLAKIARDGIASRVNEALIKQDTVKSRIASLKSRCETAGLKVEFSHDDIKHFISEPEATYNAKLDAMISRAVDTQNKLSAKLEKDAQEKLEKEMAKVRAENESSKVQVASIETQSTSNTSEDKPTQSTDEVFVVEVKMQLKLDKRTYEHLVKNGNSVLTPNIEKCFKTYIQNSCSFKKI